MRDRHSINELHDWSVSVCGRYIAVKGLHRHDTKYCKIHYGNDGAYVWYNRRTYYI